MADDVNVQFGAEVQAALAGINQLASSIVGLANPFNSVISKAQEAAIAVAAAFAVHEVINFVKEMGKLGEETERTAAKLGLTTEEVGKFNAIAAITGGDAGGMTQVLARLQLSLSKVQDAGSPAGAALEALGLKAKDLLAMPMSQQMDAIANAISRYGDGANKTAIAQALLGRAGAEMIPVLNKGAEGFAEIEETARRAGTIMSAETVSAFAATDDKIDELRLSFQGLGISIFSHIKPAVDGLVSIFTNLVQQMTGSINEGGVLSGILDTLVVAIQGVIIALAIVIAFIQTLWEVAKTVVFAVAELFVTLGKVIYRAITGDFSGAKEAFSEFGAQMAARAGVMAHSMEDIIKRAMGTIKTTLGGGGGGEWQGPKQPAPGLNIINPNVAKAAQSAIDAEIAVLKQGFEQKKLLIDTDYKLHLISEEQKIALIRQATEEEYQAELVLMKKKLGIRGLDVAARQGVLNQISVMEAKHRTDMLKLDQESVLARAKAFEKLADTVKSAWDSQLRGLLTGQTTWAQAFKNIMLDLTIEFIKWCEKQVIEWGIAQMAKTAATQTGVAAQAAAEVAGTATTLPMRIAKFTSDITADAALVFSGIFANLAPLMGPLAAGPAGAGSASVLASMAAVPKFEQGAWRIPRVMGAILHPGERVLNAKEAAESRGEIAGGGGGNIHIHAIDAAGVAAFVQRNAGALAAAVASHQKRNPSSRGKW